jgi:uncharacterized protein YukE
MSFLDVATAALSTGQNSFQDQANLMRSTIHSAEQSAVASQAFHQGDAAAAFQVGHARFVEASGKINALLDIASANLCEGAAQYTAKDAANASANAAAAGLVPHSV